ncbi:hypothetical protein H8356DRAFT_1392908 [Neocallimastix lanati (nom. inval.)]|nr:hypothetical protein H8356DRAFT_1392908 [Neocallimastix sp. JGI-2020a]
MSICFTVDGDYGFLSNFYNCSFSYRGLTYTSSEAAWQAQKCRSEEEKKKFTMKTPAQAKTAGRRVKLRPDWEAVKYTLMVEVCYQKFIQNPTLREKYLATGEAEIIEDTTGWHDNLWGQCSCSKCKIKNGGEKGQNLLGKALMEVRKKIREENQ